MKEKPWEAKIPDGNIKHWWDFIVYEDTLNLSMFTTVKPFYYITKGIHANKQIKVSISEDDFNISQMWIKENELPLINWQKFDYHEEYRWWYVFRFRDEESAMAFKLWII